MSLSQALNVAASGLRATQASLSIVAANVANSGTPGYVRKDAVQVTTVAGDLANGVRVTAVNRELDTFAQSQLRVESSGGSYADVKADFYQQLQDVYGQPGSSTGLDTVFNNFTNAIQGLAASPDSASARDATVSAAQVQAQQLNGMSSDIQGLRSDADQAIGDSVAQVNNALQQIAHINQQLAGASTQDASTAGLLDQRDGYIDQLATQMDVRVVPTSGNQVNIFTNSGVQLVGTTAATLAFNSVGTLGPSTQWNADPSKSSAGTISLVSANGSSVDLVASGTFRSGQIAAYLEMRDKILPGAQDQLDQVAASMSQALSSQTTAGTTATAGTQSGYAADVGSLLSGNTVNLSYTDTATNTQHNVTIVRVDDPSVLPLPASGDPNNPVIGINFSGGTASVAAQLNSVLGATGLQFSNPSGTTLRVLDDGSGGKVDVDSLSATATVTSLTNGGAALPMFTDGSSAYSGAITAGGNQSLGYAGRITVNAALVADPSKLVLYQSSTAAGDSTRPDFLLSQLTAAPLNYSPQAGIGTAAAPFSGTVGSYISQMMSQQGDAASAAANLKQGQDVVVSTLQQRFNDSSSVNIDDEMSKLLNLQTAYSANARVMTTINSMLDELLKVVGG